MVRLLAALIFALACASPACAQRYPLDLDYAWAPFIQFDAQGAKFRIWYNENKGNHLSLIYRETTDPTNDKSWSGEQVLMTGPAYGTTVVDEGVPGPERFKRAVFWDGVGGAVRREGLYLQTSSDGKVWNFTSSDPIVGPSDDIVDLWKDPRTGTYGIFIKHMVNEKRETMLSRSSDFVNWSKPVTVFKFDPDDQGVTEFYGVACCLLRDNLLIGFLRILRSDIDQGIGYTVLTWSRDGDHWERSREPFMAGCPGAFDAANAWVYGAAEHDGTIYLSYSAYDQGHKVGNRAVAIAVMPSKDLSFDHATGPHC
jgi:hypothetical protein